MGESLKNKVNYKLLKAVVTSIGMTYLFGLQMMSIWPIVLLLIMYYVFKQDVKLDRRGCICTSSCAAFFSFCCVLAEAENGEAGLSKVIKLIVVLIGIFFLFQRILEHLFVFLNKIDVKEFEGGKKKYILGFGWIGTMVCWLPYYLKYYPGVITLDSLLQIRQAIGVDGYSNHHPFAHTILIKYLLKVVSLFVKNETTAIGLVVLIQMMLLAMVFSIVTTYIYHHFNKKLAILTWIFYSIVPYNGIYSISLWKDIWFAGICVGFLLFLYFYDVLYDDISKLKKSGIGVGLLLTGIGVCLFRSNGYFAFFFLIIFLFVKYIFDRKKNKLIIILGIAFAIATLIKGPVYQKFDVMPGDYIEKLSLPAQNIACVVASGGELKKEEKQLLSKIIDVDKIAESYSGWLSDPIKNLVREKGNQEYLEKHKGEYFKLWIKLGIRYPKEYLKSWINQTKGYWYPNTEYWVYAENVCENDINIHAEPQISSKVEMVIKKWTDFYKECPIYGTLWEISAFVWGLIILMMYVIYRKKWNIIGIYVFLLGIWGTLLIATPVYAEFRYLYSLVAAFPLISAIPFFKRKIKH